MKNDMRLLLLRIQSQLYVENVYSQRGNENPTLLLHFVWQPRPHHGTKDYRFSKLFFDF